MITKPRFPAFCLIALLAPALAWAANEPADSPATQPAATTTAVAPALVQPLAEQSAPPKTISATPTPAASIPAKSAPVSVAPLKPASAPVATAKPALIPGTAAKTAPGTAAKPVPVPIVPAKPAPAVPVTPAKPAAAQSATSQASPMLTLPIQKVPEPSVKIDSQTVDIEVFIREGCLNCGKANEFLNKLKKLKPELKINIRDVRKEPAALELLKRMAQNQGVTALDYPAFVVGGQLIIGFSEEANTAQQILDDLPVLHPATQQADNGSQNCETGREPSCGLIPPAPVAKPESIIIDVFGHNVPLARIGIPLFTIAMGLLDGLNHGSTWVLVLMISLLAPMKDRTLMLSIAGTFIAVQGLFYFVLMTIWFNLISLIEISRMTQIAFSSIAVITGAIYLKNYLYFGHSISFSSHEIAKPGIYTRIRKIAEAETLLTALLGTVLLAILVQIGEFSYTSAFPALFTHVLALQKLDGLSNYAYLLLYDFAYMLDDVIVLAIGVITFSQERPQEKSGRMLKLISGLVLVGLATYLMLGRH